MLKKNYGKNCIFILFSYYLFLRANDELAWLASSLKLRTRSPLRLQFFAQVSLFNFMVL
jgi:hypothetical protein